MELTNERKLKSELQLKKLGIPINENLPLTELDSDVNVRTKEEIIDRIIALTIVSAKGMGASNGEIDEFIEVFKAFDLFTDEEKIFIEKKSPKQREFIQYSWKIECIWVLLWSINIIQELGIPTNTCDVDLVYETVLSSTKEDLIKKTSLRGTNEILDSLDFTYRSHWADRDAQLNGSQIPSNFNEGVIYERHYTFNWLVNYMEEEWDAVSTDT
ncbi:hypothetical protein BED47_03675 [Gottfriedia luciferensis]|uniref:DUF4272 domain-containing protein n=1 Tax=Gottfriedia luciferensis TaxID=178774 RepID=A0ABX2ZYE6_9BACI|nr:DUF4272 domain-containing protein [Gottfriedia luciferensis]ODG93399.1 hypothetical protein BED47_03675 [Gottfriedia luciferensis]